MQNFNKLKEKLGIEDFVLRGVTDGKNCKDALDDYATYASKLQALESAKAMNILDTQSINRMTKAPEKLDNAFTLLERLDKGEEVEQEYLSAIKEVGIEDALIRLIHIKTKIEKIEKEIEKMKEGEEKNLNSGILETRKNDFLKGLIAYVYSKPELVQKINSETDEEMAQKEKYKKLKNQKMLEILQYALKNFKVKAEVVENLDPSEQIEIVQAIASETKNNVPDFFTSLLSQSKDQERIFSF